MERLDREFLAILEYWKDRDAPPDDQLPALDREEISRFYDMIQLLCWLGFADEHCEVEPTANQRRAVALAQFATVVSRDGIRTGILLISPWLVEIVEEVAASLGRPQIASQLKRIRDVVPVDFWSLTNLDERWNWIQRHDSVLEALSSIEGSHEFDNARMDMMLVAANIAFDNPDEFFEK